MTGRCGYMPELSCEFRRLIASINVQFGGGGNVTDTESFAGLSEGKEKLTVSEVPDRR